LYRGNKIGMRYLKCDAKFGGRCQKRGKRDFTSGTPVARRKENIKTEKRWKNEKYFKGREETKCRESWVGSEKAGGKGGKKMFKRKTVVFSNKLSPPNLGGGEKR